MHVDDFIWEPTHEDAYARWVLHTMRLPAYQHAQWHKWFKHDKLYCTYEGERYEVVGASRLGDIWLKRPLSQALGYDLRVDVEACSEWSRWQHPDMEWKGEYTIEILRNRHTRAQVENLRWTGQIGQDLYEKYCDEWEESHRGEGK